MKSCGRTKFFVIFFAGAILPVFVIFKSIFPTLSYQSIKSDGRGNKILPLSIGSQEYFNISPFYDYDFSDIDINFLPSDKKSGKCDFEVYNDNIFTIYPRGEAIETTEELEKFIYDQGKSNLPNGSLISDEQAVYVVSRGKMLPFISPEAFVRLGYQWETVQSFSGNGQDALEEGEKMTISSPHPDGTMVRDERGNFFLIWEKQLLPIKDEQLIFSVWKNYVWISEPDMDPNLIGKCSAEIENEGDVAKCGVEVDNAQNLSSANYFVKGGGICTNNAENIRISMGVKYSDIGAAKQSIKDLVFRIKDRYVKK